MGKLITSMAIFNSKLLNYQRVYSVILLGIRNGPVVGTLQNQPDWLGVEVTLWQQVEPDSIITFWWKLVFHPRSGRVYANLLEVHIGNLVPAIDWPITTVKIDIPLTTNYNGCTVSSLIVDLSIKLPGIIVEYGRYDIPSGNQTWQGTSKVVHFDCFPS